jgi:predicted nucleic acid-binding protein
MRVIVDTSAFIAIDRIGQVGLLRQLFASVVRPQAVLDELLAGGDAHPLSTFLTGADWIETEPNPKSSSLRPELGRGETAAITLAYESQADLIVLDDLQARLVAAGLGIRVTGTIGILLAAKKNGFGPAVVAIETARLLGDDDIPPLGLDAGPDLIDSRAIGDLAAHLGLRDDLDADLLGLIALGQARSEE